MCLSVCVRIHLDGRAVSVLSFTYTLDDTHTQSHPTQLLSVCLWENTRDKKWEKYKKKLVVEKLVFF